ncbi:MAG: hypothetical protein JJE27_00755 [Thermoleophilia bacterium]|nr:hypothetical protein [Thermoleophilia bacterium]
MRLSERIQPALDRLTRSLENRKVEWALWAGLFAALTIFTIFRPLFPSYDTYYALIWGNEIGHGQLPDYSVFNTPTPHPLFNVYTAVLSLTGGAAIQLVLILSLAIYVGLLVGVFRMVQLKIGTLVAFFSVLILLTRTDLIAFAFRSMLDIPFLALIVWAAVLELKRPRRGLAPLVLLTLAGLLRPEAWLLAGLYWLWLTLGAVKPSLDLPGEQPARGQLVGYAFLVASAPLIWLGWDWIVTGDPLYSISSTREVAGALNRQKSLPRAISLLPRLVGGNERVVNTLAGALGLGLALYVLRARMLMLAGLAATGALTYLLIAAAGLSVISRYLVIPSVVMCIGVAFALVGWVQLKGTPRRVGVWFAVFALLLMLVRVPAYLHDVRQLNTSTNQVSVKFSRIYKILDKPKIRARIEKCLPIVAFTHESVPVIRYLLDLPKAQVSPTTQFNSPPTKGTLLIQTSAADPFQLTVVDRLLRKPWTGMPQPGFTFRGENRAWMVYTSCGGAK